MDVTPIPKGHRPPRLAITDQFHNTSIVQGVWASGGSSSQTIHGTLRCASNDPVCLSERFGYLWCTFVCVTFTAECNWRASRQSTRTNPAGRNTAQCCNRFQTPNHGTWWPLQSAVTEYGTQALTYNADFQRWWPRKVT